jgi:competence protein ComEC
LAVLLAAGSVIGFAALVGGQASVVRAALMGCIGLLAVIVARQSGGGGALWLTAAAMLAWSPLSLKHDVGFQLSFAAVWGLGAFGPKMTEAVGFLPASLGIRQSAAESLAATLATIPVIMFVFGRLPLIGPVVNAVILPLIPLSMLLGALAIVAAPIGYWLALPFAWLAYALLWLVGTVVNQSAQLGFWAIEADISPWLAIFMIGGLAALAWRWRPVQRAKTG